MRDPIFIVSPFDETERFLLDMEKHGLPSLRTDACTDAILRRFTEQYQANRVAPLHTRPDRCSEGTRKPCTSHPQWRVREKGDTAHRNWVWTCGRHLAAACASYGERAQVDVIREGL